MQEYSDYVTYFLSYFDIGQSSRHHPIGDIVFVATYITVMVLLRRSYKLYYQFKKNNTMGGKEKHRLLNYHIRRIILFAIFLILLTLKLMMLATPVFYN
jgi:hypothetical protein